MKRKRTLWVALTIFLMLSVVLMGYLAQTPEVAAVTWMFQGRVYSGEFGDESHPLMGVTVSVYGANNSYPDPGTFIRSTTTDDTGWYGLPVYDDDGAYEYYHIRETDPLGYVSVGATTVDGTVRTSNWIEYVTPLKGKTLTGNKFWDRVPVLSGRVYEGVVGDESHPLRDVTVSLYGGNNPYPDPGTFIRSTTTNATGWYGLEVTTGWEYYHIRETDPPGYTSVGATTVDGTVRTINWIEYVIPLEVKTLTGNKFWDRPPTSITCNSCEDCTNKLKSGLYDTVILTTDITDHAGSCISLLLGESNVVFDGDGHTIDGDDIAIDPEHGIAMMHGAGNTIKNCVISDFSEGIYLWDATNHVITGNSVISNDVGIELGFSDSNNINNNTVSDNYDGMVIADSSGNTINSNIVCNNTNVDLDICVGNSGDENTCNTPDGWNDDGTTGCTYSCPSEMPDLVITEVLCDRDNDRIGYRVENIGKTTAPACHHTVLRVKVGEAWEEMCSDHVDFDLEPEGTYQGWFGCYTWPECHTIEVKVCADRDNAVAESEEENNCREGICECVPVEKPDLVITDVWNEDSTICYQIRNIGEAVAPGGHYTGLFVDEEYIVSGLVDADLEPGEGWTGCFDYVWACTPPEDSIMAWADYRDDITESDETNNRREESWGCDTTPPEIISGPTVLEVTQNSATIFWETNKDSDSVVKYGKKAGRYASEETDSTLVTAHNVTLTALDPSTTYNFVVQSTDLSGNTVRSTDRTFETLPLPDDIDPIVSIIDPGICQETVKILAEASDNRGVEKVEFYLDDEPVFTDYSPPYQVPLDTAKYENGEYTLKAKVYDLSGRPSINELPINILNVIDVTAPSVTITSPRQNDIVSGTVTVTATLSDDTGLLSAYFYVDGVYTEFEPFPTNPKSATAQFTWDTTQVANGDKHRIGVVAYDKDSKSGLDTVDVTVSTPPPPAQPKLKISHSVTRYENYFAISLTVENVGGETASNIVIQDFLQGFQPISDTAQTPVHAKYEAKYDAWKREWECRITSYENIPKTDSRIYTYFAVPVLFDSNPPAPQIGHLTGVHYDKDLQGLKIHDWFAVPVPQAMTGGQSKPIKQAYEDALKEADYLIVTNPTKLFAFGSTQTNAVYTLLSDMAELARYQKGVLGYMAKSDKHLLRKLIKPGEYSSSGKLIKPGGDWAKRLHPNFSKPLSGYLLLVGETEIIPAWDIPQKGTGPIHHSDQPYSDTYGNDERPELAVGRIIGNDAAKLAKAIRTSICLRQEPSPYCDFDRSHALVVAGDGPGEDDWEKEAKKVANILDDEFSVVDKLLWNDYKSYSAMYQQFINRVKNKDVIFYTGHGSPYIWQSVIDEQGVTGNPAATPPIPPISFVGINPFLFASACSTANYDPAGDNGIAEAFFDRGAAVYIGSTVPYAGGSDPYTRFFTKWVNASKSIGRAFIETERDRIDYYKDYNWVREFNLYGDPKIGGTKSASVATAPSQIVLAEEPLSFLQVVVPDYEVTTVDGLDYVEIPDGMSLFVEGKPQVPFYCVRLGYPSGYEVQDVLLTERSGLIGTTGLNIPNATLIVKNRYGEEQGSAVLTSWYPEGEYSWDVLENPDGSTTLVIVMYPFYYNPLTTDVRFYKNYSFDITYTVSPVAITSLTTDKDEYEQGDTVMVDIGLNSTAEAQDVIVSALLKRYDSHEIVDGLLLRTLEEFTGPASFSPQWDSSGLEPGYYYVELTLQDTGGDVLDRKTEMFRLGISSGEVTSFTATPEYFDIGDEIDISLVFDNAGTVDISGTAVIRVQDEAGELVQEFEHEFTDLAPSDSVSFDDTWDTSGAEEGCYRVVGYVLYDAKATDVASAEIIAEWDPMVYDENEDGEIEKDEAIQAVMDYFDGEIDKMQAIEVIMLYFE